MSPGVEMHSFLVNLARANLEKAVQEIISKAQASSRKDQILGRVQIAVLDVTDEDSILQIANQLTKDSTTANANSNDSNLVNDNDSDKIESRHLYWDALVFSAAGKAPHGPIAELPTAQTRELFKTKFWGAYNVPSTLDPYSKVGDLFCL